MTLSEPEEKFPASAPFNSVRLSLKEEFMGQNDRGLRKICWRIFALLVLAGGYFLAAPQPVVRADACMDAYNVCVSNCYNDASCLYNCVHEADTNNCFVAGDQWKCDDVFSQCRNIGGLGSGSDEGDCFDVYATCEYNAASAARAGYVRLRGMDLEPDDPCLVAARDDYYTCLDGGNSICLSQVDSSVVSGCCEGEFKKSWAACYGNYGP